MFHVCVQRFDGMDEKILDGELNRVVGSSLLGSRWKGKSYSTSTFGSENTLFSWWFHFIYVHVECNFFVGLTMDEASGGARGALAPPTALLIQWRS